MIEPHPLIGHIMLAEALPAADGGEDIRPLADGLLALEEVLDAAPGRVKPALRGLLAEALQRLMRAGQGHRAQRV